MRIALALVGIMCSAVATSAATPVKTWCSDGFDKPAKILFDPGTSSGGDRFEITIGGELQPFDDAEEVALSGPNTVRGADLYLYGEGTRGDKQDVIIYRDRVFWPCK
jgi:hypothetical protein